MSRRYGFLVDHFDFHFVIGGDKLVLVFVAAIMRRLEFLPDDVAVSVDAALIR
jgi:hypothetical protein